MEKFEAGSVKQGENARGKKPLERSQSGDSVHKRVVVCYRCGQEDHFTRGCAQPSKKKTSYQGNYLPFEVRLYLQGKHKGQIFAHFIIH